MAGSGNRWNEPLVVRIVSTIAAFCWFGVLILWTQYDDTRPTSAQPSDGRTYALQTHGHVVFLTQTELSTLYILGIVGAMFLVVAITVRLSKRKRS
jgi:hypothetical protein